MVRPLVDEVSKEWAYVSGEGRTQAQAKLSKSGEEVDLRIALLSGHTSYLCDDGRIVVGPDRAEREATKGERCECAWASSGSSVIVKSPTSAGDERRKKVEVHDKRVKAFLFGRRLPFRAQTRLGPSSPVSGIPCPRIGRCVSERKVASVRRLSR